jgi:hypothetical protein
MTLQTQENPMEEDIWTAAEMDGTAGAPKQSTLVGGRTRTGTSGSTVSVFDRIERDEEVCIWLEETKKPLRMGETKHCRSSFTRYKEI